MNYKGYNLKCFGHYVLELNPFIQVKTTDLFHWSIAKHGFNAQPTNWLHCPILSSNTQKDRKSYKQFLSKQKSLVTFSTLSERD